MGRLVRSRVEGAGMGDGCEVVERDGDDYGYDYGEEYGDGMEI